MLTCQVCGAGTTLEKTKCGTGEESDDDEEEETDEETEEEKVARRKREQEEQEEIYMEDRAKGLAAARQAKEEGRTCIAHLVSRESETHSYVFFTTCVVVSRFYAG